MPDCFLSPVVIVLVFDVDAMHSLRVIDVQHPRLYNMVNGRSTKPCSGKTYTEEALNLGKWTVGLDKILNEMPTVVVEDLEHAPCRRNSP